jgi:hydrogenase nickel incorporation protein HypA/HybF
LEYEKRLPIEKRFSVHELSIAQSLVTTATEVIRQHSPAGNSSSYRVAEVHLRLGKLAGVAKEALHFCYDIATQDTLLAGSQLVIEELPVIVFCESCQQEVELPGIQRFRCPICNLPSGNIRQGREMELATIHFFETPLAMPAACSS